MVVGQRTACHLDHKSSGRLYLTQGALLTVGLYGGQAGSLAGD